MSLPSTSSLGDFLAIKDRENNDLDEVSPFNKVIKSRRRPSKEDAVMQLKIDTIQLPFCNEGLNEWLAFRDLIIRIEFRISLE